ncbi:MAG: V-type ATP synthase subunit F [Bacillota bacterium]|nr:V-type ATP synthase subunit F [Bacillota bacterium]
MDKHVEVAAIGRTDAVLLYNAAGFQTFIVAGAGEADKIVFQLSNAKCKVILIDEDLYPAMTETLKKYKTSAFPILMPVPMSSASKGIGMKKIQENVEKAIGINIF